jgi:hypothetical protein
LSPCLALEKSETSPIMRELNSYLNPQRASVVEKCRSHHFQQHQTPSLQISS